MIKSGGVNTDEEQFRFEVVAILVGVILMLAGVVLINFKNTSSVALAFVATLYAAFFLALSGTLTNPNAVVLALSVVLAVIAINYAVGGNKKLLFLTAAIYEVGIILALYLIA